MNVYNEPKIVDAFNDFLTNIGQKQVIQIPKSSKSFETYINKVNVIIGSMPLSINELKDAFSLLKVNKSWFADDVSFDIINKCFGVLYKPFIDFSEAFDAVDHSILLKKLKFYGITNKNLAWFENYLSSRK